MDIAGTPLVLLNPGHDVLAQSRVSHVGAATNGHADCSAPLQVWGHHARVDAGRVRVELEVGEDVWEGVGGVG